MVLAFFLYVRPNILCIIIYYKETDIDFFVQYNTDDFYSEVRLFAMYRRAPQKDFSKNIFDSNLFLNINKKLDVLLYISS